jgi:SAM-dependent methyltransferase
MTQEPYDTIGEGYAGRRQPDPRIAAAIVAALADARSVINVGAGAGSYEPTDRTVLALEPSDVMIRQRPLGAAPCVRASAEALPVEDGAFDAAMAVLTIHHWSDWRRGLRELLDSKIMPPLDALAEELGAFKATPLLVPHDCKDGFLGAYWRRPEIYLDAAARQSMSSFAKIDASRGLSQLARDLDAGVWRERNADIITLDALDLGYRLLLWEFERDVRL